MSINTFQFYCDDFDSSIFGRLVCKLYIPKGDFKKYKHYIKKLKPDIIFCFTDYARENILFLEQNKFTYISTRSSFKHEINNQTQFRIDLGLRIKGLNDFDHLNMIPLLNKITSEIMLSSRYYKDESLDRSKVMKLYQTWSSNSIIGGYADEVIVLYEDKVIAGYVTLKIRNKGAYIDLIGIDSSFQGKGLGSVLINACKNYCVRNRIRQLFVITEQENIRAVRFYERNEFFFDDLQLIYHKHINRE